MLPYRWQEDSATDYARSVHALLAEPRGKATYSLSPRSLMALPAGSRIVLPSPNGATLSLTTGATPTFTGCLRNARSVAAAARACDPCVAVIACHAPILQRRSLIGDSVRGHSRNHCLGDGMVHQVLQALVRPRIDSGDRRRRRLGRQPVERRIFAQSSLARVPIRAAYSFAEPDRAAIFPIRRHLHYASERTLQINGLEMIQAHIGFPDTFPERTADLPCRTIKTKPSNDTESA